MAKVRELKLYALETKMNLAIVEAHNQKEAIENSDFSKSQIEIIRETTEEDVSYLKSMGGYIVKSYWLKILTQ